MVGNNCGSIPEGGVALEGTWQPPGMTGCKVIPMEEVSPKPEHADSDTGGREGSLLVLAVLALVVGAASGFVGALFRLALEQAERLRGVLIGWAHGKNVAGFLLVSATCAAATWTDLLLTADSRHWRTCAGKSWSAGLPAEPERGSGRRHGTTIAAPWSPSATGARQRTA